MKVFLGFMTRVLAILSDFYFIKIRRQLPVRYFSGVKNAGDDLNRLVFEGLSGKKVYNVKTQLFKHILPIGSIMFYEERKSIVFGSGFISENSAQNLKTKCVVALRGELSKEVYQEKTGLCFDGFLGDPAVLAPRVYHPHLKKKNKVGVVLHYAHKDLFGNNYWARFKDVSLIDVQVSGKDFVEKILACDYIVSSSLHGLILADAYDVKNCWVSLAEGLPGGDFKFNDYYSTTDKKNEKPVCVNSEKEMTNLIENIEGRSSVKKYLYDKDEFLKVFYCKVMGSFK